MPEEMDDMDGELAALIEQTETEPERYRRVATVVAAAAACGESWQLAVDLGEAPDVLNQWSDAGYDELAKLSYRDLQCAVMLQIFAKGSPKQHANRILRFVR